MAVDRRFGSCDLAPSLKLIDSTVDQRCEQILWRRISLGQVNNSFQHLMHLKRLFDIDCYSHNICGRNSVAGIRKFLTYGIESPSFCTSKDEAERIE